MKILFLCTHNRCRSQIARAITKNLFPEFEVYSAGSDPAKQVHPWAIKSLSKIGIDISKIKPNHISKYLDQDFDYVITLCDSAKDECPIFGGVNKYKLHIGFVDPSANLNKKTEQEIYKDFDKTIELMQKKFSNLFTKKH